MLERILPVCAFVGSLRNIAVIYQRQKTLEIFTFLYSCFGALREGMWGRGGTSACS